MTKCKQILASKYVEYSMLFSIFAYTLFKVADRKIGDVFIALIMLGTVLALIVHRKYFIKDKMLYLFLAAIIVQFLAWLHGIYFSPYTPIEFDLSPLANLFYFIPIAYWLKGNPRYVLATLTVFCVGTILAFIMKSNHPLDEFFWGLKGHRVDFNITNANHTAALAGMATMLATFLLYSYFNLSNIIKNQWIKWGWPIILIILLLINLLLVYMTFSRATWLALTVIFLLTPFILMINRQHLKTVQLTFTLLGVLLLLFAIIQIPQISSRIHEENYIIQDLVNKPLDDVADSSVSLRVKFWQSAIPWIKDYPLLGLGDRYAREFVIQQSPYLSPDMKNEYSHLHNGHLEIMVAYGIPALLIAWGIFIYIFKTTFDLSLVYKGYIIYGIVAFTLYYFIINCFESFFMFKSGEFIQSIVLGCIYTFYMKQNLNKFQTSIEN